MNQVLKDIEDGKYVGQPKEKEKIMTNKVW